MAYPTDRKYTKEHEWIKIEGNTGTAGITWSDDVSGDPRFASALFHAFPHRSGAVVPIHVDGDVAGALYLVWWSARSRSSRR